MHVFFPYLWKEELDRPDQKVHGIDVNEGVVLDIAMLNFDRNILTAVGQGGSVDLGQTCCSQWLFIEARENLFWLFVD